MEDGQTLDFPGLRLQVLHTPGHTIESISILVFDLQKDPPSHTLCSRETLCSSATSVVPICGLRSDGARGILVRTCIARFTKTSEASRETLVYPAHGSGSLCGKNLSSDTVSTLGVQRRMNYALQPMSPEEFIDLVTADQPDAPPYFTYDAILNTRERASLEKNLEQVLHPIELEEVLRMGDAGTQILDVREAAEFAKGHLAGSINIGLGGQYATWAGTVLDRTKPIVILAEPGREQEAALRLGRIGFDHVKGYLKGGMEALAGRPDLVWPTERLSAPMIAEELAGAARPLVLDIRSPREWSAKHIDGSLNIPLNHLQERIAEVPRDRKIAVHCAGGYRSSIAASILHQHGITHLTEMAGGLAAWEAAKLPVVSAT